MAIFEWTETTYIDTIWYAAWEGADWMAVLSKPSAEAAWELVYRFRYYSPDSTGLWDDENQDQKSVYEMKGADPSEERRAKIAEAADRLMELQPGTQKTKLLVRGNESTAIELLGVQPWAHMKTMDLGENKS